MVLILIGHEFRVDTNKGRLYAYVEAETAGFGEELLRAFIEKASEMSSSDLSIKAIRLLKRAPRPTCITIVKGHSSPICGRDFWYAVGRGVEYELKLAELKESWEKHDG